MKIQTLLKYLPIAGFSFAFGNTINAHLTNLETKKRIEAGALAKKIIRSEFSTK